MRLRVACFTEAGKGRGMGHFVRMRTLAHAFAKAGCDLRFYLDGEKDFVDRYPGVDSFSWDSLPEMGFDIVCIDSYEAPSAFYRQLYERSKLLVCIDDFRRLDYPPGIVVNFAPDAKERWYPDGSPSHVYLLGPSYLLLREGLARMKGMCKKDEIFIMLGGTDVRNLTFDVARALRKHPFKKVVVTSDVRVAERTASLPGTVPLLSPGDSALFQAMAQSRIAVTTASMSLYELAFLETPALAFAVAENQKEGIEALRRHRFAAGVIDIAVTDWLEGVPDAVEAILRNPPDLPPLDTLGAERVVKEALRLCERF